MRKITLLIIISVLAAAVFISCADKKSNETYICPMHPQIVQNKPGSCPICGMDLVIMEKGHEGHSDPAGEHAQIYVSPRQQQLINIRFDEVKERPLAGFIEATGVVAYDPALYSARAEYLSAVKLDNPALIEAAEIKLKSLGLSGKQISEISGGNKEDIFSSLYIYAQVYQDSINLVKIGAEAEVYAGISRLKYYAKVTGIDPVMNPETRSFRVRLKMNEGALALKPEMYAEVRIQMPGKTALSVPSEAILDTGRNKLVFLDAGNGHLEPRYIVTGSSAGGYEEVLSGLKKGDRVVVNGNFLIDSESRLKSALSAMGAHDHDK